MPNGHHGNWKTSSSGGSYGGGEDFGSPFGGGSPYSPPSTASEAHVPYDPGPGPRGGETPVQTGIFQSDPQGDPNDEKGDYMDWDAINQQTGLTAGQTLAQNTDAALKAQNERKIAMQNAMAMKEGATSQAGITDINALSDRDLETMRDAGLFAGEAEGVLGGVAGIEQEVNKMKRALTYGDVNSFKKSKDSLIKLGFSEDAINKLSPDIIGKDKSGKEIFVKNPDFDPNLAAKIGYDPTGMLMHNQIFGTEADALSTGMDPAEQNRLKWAYWGLTGDPSADQLRQHLPTYGPLGYKALGGARGSGGGSGGYGYGYGYGGGGGGGGGYGYGDEEDPLARGYQRGKVGPGGLLEAVNQLYFRLSGMNKKRGGIIGLLRL